MKNYNTGLVWLYAVLLLFPAILLSPSLSSANEYVGMSECVDCHDEYYVEFQKTKMGKRFLNNPQNELEKRVCETCHGPGADHIAAWDDSDVLDLDKIISFKQHSHQSAAEQNEKCLQCHDNFSYLNGWAGSTHETQDVKCATCHKVMVKVSEDKALVKKKQMDVCFQCHAQKKAQMSRTSHIPMKEGKIVCTNCHNPHGGKGEPLLIEASVNEVCYQCHADRRGPMLWEHAPVRENCANCHDPHGTNYPRLLKIKTPFLCQTCHSAALHSSELVDARRGVNGVRPSSRLLGKYCVNCHSRIHGSNHPSGARFQR